MPLLQYFPVAKQVAFSSYALFQRGFCSIFSSRLSSISSVQRTTCLSLLKPLQIQPCRTYKMKATLKRRCAGCYFERRFGRLYIECTLKPRHKQMQLQRGTARYKDDYSTGKWLAAVHWGWEKKLPFYRMGDNKYSRFNWLEGRIGKEI